MDAIEPVTSILKAVALTIKKYIEYHTRHKDYVDGYKDTQKKLKNRQEDVAEGLRTQLRQPGKIPKQEVTAWLEEADQETAEKVVDELTCKGGCFTYIWSSRKLEKRTQSLKEQIFMPGERYTNASECLVIDVHPSKGVGLPVNKCSGRDDIQDQILQLLKGGNITRIAVSGIPGVGKTMIMKHVHNQLLKESKFNEVIFVKVPKDCDVTVQGRKKFDTLKLQKLIASSLGLQLQPEHYENETKLVGLISQRLLQGSSLLILDDVWQSFSLEDVGIPDLVGNNGCKLVVTTRLQHIAREMGCKVIMVDPLPANEAAALFLEKVGSDVLSDGRIKRDIEPYYEQILQKCDGVPFAIVTVAKLMRGKSLSRQWKYALSEFSKFKGIVDLLELSYECLEAPCQECFLYSAMCLNNYEIPAEKLIEDWIDKGLIYTEGKTREEMDLKGYDILDKLADNCLLEVGKKENFVSMNCFIQEMALEIRAKLLGES